MCAYLVSSTGGYYYDCDEQWQILVYDDYDVNQYCMINGYRLSSYPLDGCAIWQPTFGVKMILGNSGQLPYVPSPSGYVDDYGDTLLWHEIKHLQCLCGYHDDPPENPKR